MRVHNGVVFAVAGSKGGVGKTTTSINLGAVLAEAGEDVVLVEFDLAMANVGDFLDIDVGLEGEDPTLHEVLAGTATVVDATYESPAAFDVVPSGATLRGYGDADIGRLAGVLETLRFAYDVVLLDTGAGVSEETVLPLALADETILVSSPRVASVRDTMKTRDLTRQVGGSVAGVVFVKSGTGRSPGVDHIAEFLSVDLLGHVPEDRAVPDAQDRGVPVVVAAPESAAAVAFRSLGERVGAHATALGAPDALSTDSLNQDESGFAFVDAPTETGRTDDTGHAETAAEQSDVPAEPEGRRSIGKRATEDESTTPAGDESTTPAEDGSGTSTAGVPASETPTGTTIETATDDTDTDTPDSQAGSDEASTRSGATTVEDLVDDADTEDSGTNGPETTAATEPGDESETVAAVGATGDESNEDETSAGDDADPFEPIDPSPATDVDDVTSADDAAPSLATEADDVDASDTLGVADGGRTGEDETPDETERPESQAQSQADGPESMQSATKRLIHRARDLVDRRND